ncbi:hypothetical protein Sa4125_20910 [Aureimonas sp. SA4125]|uniref:tyrosine-type recombinase/integrase n=1 Tax=Aureimonas sp. SA4125 TaxID=2826993 RepID=UPI001CC3C1E1|nr:integrase family protein [Aureimonas sp. SA4125]BDA84549.1 hypothetical protein Sa4125_20910 [Aureimonas sp. SA4125]
MPTHRVEIGPKHLAEARKAAEGRTFTTSNPLAFADVVEKGLILRVQSGSAGWVLKWNGKTRSLGKLDDVKSAKAAREAAQKVRALLKDGTDPAAFLTGKAAGKVEAEAFAEAERRTAIASGRWTWETLAERYVSYLSEPRMTSRGIVKPPSPATANEARRYLGMDATAPLRGRLVSDLRPGDLEDVRDSALALSKSASRQFVAYSKAALSFARRKHSRASGLEGSPKWWLEVEKLDATIPAARSRHPSIKELARVLWIAETNRVAAGREVNRETSEEVLSALWWLALTAQRTGAGLSIRRAHILPWPDGPAGWRVAFWPANVMKSKRPHSVPLPARAVLLIERAVAASETASPFVFPAKRTRGGRADVPMTKTTPGLLLRRLRGQPPSTVSVNDEDEGQDEAEATTHGPDLLDGIPHFSPHDLRRTFATTLGDLAIRGDAVSAVLDHTQELGTAGRFAPATTAADITRLAYDYSQRLELKRIAVEAWTNALFSACDAEWGKHRPSRSFRVPVAPGAGLPKWLPWYVAAESTAARRATEEEERIRRARRPIDLKVLRASAWQDGEKDGSERPDDDA